MRGESGFIDKFSETSIHPEAYETPIPNFVPGLVESSISG